MKSAGIADLVRRNPWETLLLVIFVGTVVFNVTQSTNYLDVDNFVNLFELSIEKVIIAVMMTFVIIAGEIDLSVASVMGLSAAVLATLNDGGAVPFGVAILIAVAAGSARRGRPGLVRLPARPALARRHAGRADRLARPRPGLRRGPLLRRLPVVVRRPRAGRPHRSVAVRVLVFLVGIVVAGVVLARTALGRQVYVIGDNADVARYAALNVARFKLGLFVASGTVAAFAGLLYAARLGSVRGDLASGFELDIITMVLLGGVSIFGGAGTMTGVAWPC